MAWDYSEKVKKLFFDAINEKDSSHIGEVDSPDGEGFHGSLVCGDAIKLTFKVQKDKDPKKDIITEIKYLTFGCTSAIAASEAICIIIEEGKYTPIKALSITKDDVVNFLDGLPNQKIHCSIMGVEALQKAIYDWAKKRKVDLESLGIKITENKEQPKDSSDYIVCECMGHTKSYVVDQIKDLKLKTVDDVIEQIKTGSVCGKCIDKKGGIKDLLNEVNKVNNDKEKTPYMLTKEIERTVQEEIAPILAKDGGGIEIIEIRDKELFFKLKGTCKTCAAANNTIEYVIQKTLRDKVDKNIKVKQVL